MNEPTNPGGQPEPQPAPETPPTPAQATDPTPEPTTDPTAEAAVDPDTAPAPASAVRRRRRRLAALVAAVVCTGLVAGAGAWGWSALQDADRTAPTVLWAEPDPDTVGPVPEAEPTGLAAHLLPVPAHYRPGPDIKGFGNDGVLNEARAVALLKEGTRGLPGPQRKRFDKAVRDLRVKGLAMRSYRSVDAEFVVETQLAQLENKKAVSGMTAFHKSLADASGFFRKGPKITGHPKAVCLRMPKIDGMAIDGMVCTAPVGEILVRVYAYGPKGLPLGTIKEFVGDQLDHVTSPGEAV
ncbi:hypothetical protein [Streptomyces sp. NPDC005805]|uniref:hypothetical protein n=1 Tax=Streptomyces sp. NPDC005805 TaxID=3157068 RepID=UPI0033E12B72